MAALDRRSVAVQVTAAGGERVLKGVGNYEVDPDLGGVLRVALSDDTVAYEMLFVADTWPGTIEPGVAYGCDFVLRVR